MKRKLFAWFILFVFSSATLVLAEEEPTGNYFVDISSKLGRGAWNVFVSPIEIPCNMGNDVHENGWDGMFTGLFKGATYFVGRALTGVAEIASFPIPSRAVIPQICESPDRLPKWSNPQTS